MLNSKFFNCPLTATTVTLSRQRVVIPGAIGCRSKMPDQFDYGCSIENHCPDRFQPECCVQRLNNKPVY